MIFFTIYVFFLGESALHYAAAEGHIDTIELLISFKCNVNSQDINGRTGIIIIYFDQYSKHFQILFLKK